MPVCQFQHQRNCSVIITAY